MKLKIIRSIIVACFVANVLFRLDKANGAEKWINTLVLTVMAGVFTLIWQQLSKED